MSKIESSKPSQNAQVMQECVCSSVMRTIGYITAIALVILGASAYYGLRYPLSSLGALGLKIGKPGAYVMMGLGAAFFFMLVATSGNTYKDKNALDKQLLQLYHLAKLQKSAQQNSV